MKAFFSMPRKKKEKIEDLKQDDGGLLAPNKKGIRKIDKQVMSANNEDDGGKIRGLGKAAMASSFSPLTALATNQIPGSGLISAGGIKTAGGVYIGGDLDEDGDMNMKGSGELDGIGAGVYIGGELEPDDLTDRSAKHFWAEIEDMDDKQFYHWVLDLNAKEWEAIREAANQLLGGAVSSMWTGHGLDSQGAGLKTSMHHYRDILLTPNKGAAARLLELEHDAKGSGFKSAIKHSVKTAKHIVKKTGRAIDKALPKVAKFASKAARVASDISKGIESGATIAAAVPGLQEYAVPALEASKAANQAFAAAEPIIRKGEKIGESKSGLNELKKIGEYANKNPNEVAEHIRNVNEAYNKPGSKHRRTMNTIQAINNVIGEQQQPQQGAGPMAFQSHGFPAGGFKNSTMMDPRRGCR